MDEEGKAVAVAGCPPDGFAPDGHFGEIRFIIGDITEIQVLNGG